MGLFDFFKKKGGAATPSVNANRLLMEAMEHKLQSLGHHTERSTQYLSITVDGELEIAVAVIDTPGAHPLLMQALVISIHPQYFPQGIDANLVGLGNTWEEKAQSAVDNYVGSIFPALIESFGEQHSERDFHSHTDGRDILWHPNFGPLVFQGQWANTDTYTYDTLFSLLEKDLKPKLNDQKLNWLKLYISRQADGGMDVECTLNNEPWEEGERLLQNYARQWPKGLGFLAQKQFTVFRRCDAFDN